MRLRILGVALSAVVLAVALLGVPLAVVIQHNAVADERGELERAALQAAVVVSPDFRGGDPVELPTAPGGTDVGLYGTDGQRVAGRGPAQLDPAALDARRGRVVEADVDGDVVEAVPVSVHERVIGIVRAASPRSDATGAAVRDLVALAGLALLALLGAGLLAFVQARRLTAPMEALVQAATDLGAGDFSVRTPVSNVPEIDRTGAALAATAQRLSAQMERERAFAAQASHQLRTPLTRLRLELEAALAGPDTEIRAAAEGALDSADHLSLTIDDVLALTRDQSAGTEGFDVEELLTECVDAWRGAFAGDDRPLRLVVEGPGAASASRPAVRQVLQVLLDNAYRHGRGTVTLTVRESAGAVAIDVADRGTAEIAWPPPDGPAAGMGLAMARSLALSQGGRLLLADDATGTRFTLLLPGRADDRVDPA